MKRVNQVDTPSYPLILIINNTESKQFVITVTGYERKVGLWPLVGAGINFATTLSRAAVIPKQPTIQYIPGVWSRENIDGRSVKLITHFHEV